MSTRSRIPVSTDIDKRKKPKSPRQTTRSNTKPKEITPVKTTTRKKFTTPSSSKDSSISRNRSYSSHGKQTTSKSPTSKEINANSSESLSGEILSFLNSSSDLWSQYFENSPKTNEKKCEKGGRKVQTNSDSCLINKHTRTNNTAKWDAKSAKKETVATRQSMPDVVRRERKSVLNSLNRKRACSSKNDTKKCSKEIQVITELPDEKIQGKSESGKVDRCNCTKKSCSRRICHNIFHLSRSDMELKKDFDTYLNTIVNIRDVNDMEILENAFDVCYHESLTQLSSTGDETTCNDCRVDNKSFSTFGFVNNLASIPESDVEYRGDFEGTDKRLVQNKTNKSLEEILKIQKQVADSIEGILKNQCGNIKHGTHSNRFDVTAGIESQDLNGPPLDFKCNLSPIDVAKLTLQECMKLNRLQTQATFYNLCNPLYQPAEIPTDMNIAESGVYANLNAQFSRHHGEYKNIGMTDEFMQVTDQDNQVLKRNNLHNNIKDHSIKEYEKRNFNQLRNETNVDNDNDLARSQSQAAFKNSLHPFFSHGCSGILDFAGVNKTFDHSEYNSVSESQFESTNMERTRIDESIQGNAHKNETKLGNYGKLSNMQEDEKNHRPSRYEFTDYAKQKAPPLLEEGYNFNESQFSVANMRVIPDTKAEEKFAMENSRLMDGSISPRYDNVLLRDVNVRECHEKEFSDGVDLEYVGDIHSHSSTKENDLSRFNNPTCHQDYLHTRSNVGCYQNRTEELDSRSEDATTAFEFEARASCLKDDNCASMIIKPEAQRSDPIPKRNMDAIEMAVGPSSLNNLNANKSTLPDISSTSAEQNRVCIGTSNSFIKLSTQTQTKSDLTKITQTTQDKAITANDLIENLSTDASQAVDKSLSRRSTITSKIRMITAVPLKICEQLLSLTKNCQFIFGSSGLQGIDTSLPMFKIDDIPKTTCVNGDDDDVLWIFRKNSNQKFDQSSIYNFVLSLNESLQQDEPKILEIKSSTSSEESLATQPFVEEHEFLQTETTNLINKLDSLHKLIRRDKSNEELKVDSDTVLSIVSEMRSSCEQADALSNIRIRKHLHSIIAENCLTLYQEQCNIVDDLFEAMDEKLKIQDICNTISDNAFAEIDKNELQNNLKISISNRKILYETCSAVWNNNAVRLTLASPPHIKQIRRIDEYTILVKWSFCEERNMLGYELRVNGRTKTKIFNIGRKRAILGSLKLGTMVRIEVYVVGTEGRYEPPAVASYKML